MSATAPLRNNLRKRQFANEDDLNNSIYPLPKRTKLYQKELLPLTQLFPVDSIKYPLLAPLASGIFVLAHVLTVEECKELVRRSEEKGYQELEDFWDPNYRSNTRVMDTDEKLAVLLWKRVKAYFPEVICEDANGDWERCGINERFRFCKYTKDQKFNPHLDGKFVRNEKEESKWTIMIYLNDDFKGGTTDFLRKHDVPHSKPKQQDIVLGDEEHVQQDSTMLFATGDKGIVVDKATLDTFDSSFEVILRVLPKAGFVICFRQQDEFLHHLLI